ncbi:hypothetical protein C7D74_32820, partial [Klebsiella pneumoniae]
RHTLLRQLRTPGQRVKNVLIVVLAGLIVWGPIRCTSIDLRRYVAQPLPPYAAAPAAHPGPAG